MKALIYFTLVFGMSIGAQAGTYGKEWRIIQKSWDAKHEKLFGQFVSRIGEAVERRECNRVDTCLKSTANIYYGSDPAGLRYYADCADLPYYLRGYFAWKNGLPFSIASEVRPSPLNQDKVKDVRYSIEGNIVSKRMDVLSTGGAQDSIYPDAFQILNSTIPNLVSSASLRMGGLYDTSLASDFYPVKINRHSIRPGTVIYDPNGHVAIIYKVTQDGRVFYIDAHPDNSLTMGMFTPKFSRSNPNQGAGFKNFRPLTLVDSTMDDRGAYVGGRIVAAKNSELPDYSTEQFYGTRPDSANWKNGLFVFKGRQTNFHEFVRLSLTEGEAFIDPLKDMAQLTDDICVSLKDRVDAVEAARKAGVTEKPHPARLPLNIYGTEGEWENYATPSRDARLKVAFMDLLETTKSNIDRFKKYDRTIRYSGGNLAKDLYEVYKERAQACQFSYNTSSGRPVVMNLEAARQRLFDMSFDPYHCIELRWGARVRGELSSCRDDANKRAWYEKEKWLRNQWERNYEARMDYTLDQLNGPIPGVGLASPPDIDIVSFLKSKM